MNRIVQRLWAKRIRDTPADVLPEAVAAHIQGGKTLVVIGLRDAEISAAGEAIERHVQHMTGGPGAGRPLQAQSITRTQHLFEHLTVMENICLPDRRFGSVGAKQVERCRQLLHEFDIHADPLDLARRLSAEDRKLIELLRAYWKRPDILYLYDTLSDLGYLAVNSFTRILNALRDDGCRIIYLCTHWEDALRLGDYFSIMRNGALTGEIHTAEDIRSNPRRVIYLLSGIGDDALPDDRDESVSALNSIYRSSELFVKDYELGKTLAYLAESINGIMHARFSMLYIRGKQKRLRLFPSDQALQEACRLDEDFVLGQLDGPEEIRHFNAAQLIQQKCFREPDAAAHSLLCIRFDIGSAGQGLLEIVFDKACTLSEQQYLILHTFCNEVVLLIDTSRLFDQSVLLREAHHRIKNNLQIIIGIIYSQKMNLRLNGGKADYPAALESLVSRIKSISMVHDLLSRSTLESNRISLRMLVDKVLGMYHAESVRIVQDMQDLYVEYNDATSLAMLFNELISNVFKHAFKDTPEPEIRIRCAMEAQDLVMSVTDNGVGLEAGFSIEDVHSVGMSIVTDLVKGLHGRLDIRSDRGTTVEIRVPSERLFEDRYVWK